MMYLLEAVSLACVGCGMLQSSGPLFGYYPNPSKTCLIVKSEHLRNAEAQFKVRVCKSLHSIKGASSWLTTIPMLRYSYNLNKQAFRDALCLRFSWTPTRLPQHFSCGHPFSVDSTVQKGPCLQFGTTLSGTSLPNSSPKCAQMLGLSPHFNPCIQPQNR